MSKKHVRDWPRPGRDQAAGQNTTLTPFAFRLFPNTTLCGAVFIELEFTHLG